MKLSNTSIKKLVKGACYFEERNGYLYPYHYTKEQIEYFSRFDFWDIRARLFAGGKIEFLTDATEISIKVLHSCFCSCHSTLDLYVNDVCHSIAYLKNCGGSVVDYALPQGKKKVSIYFPIDSEIGIKDLIFNGYCKTVKEKQKRVLAIGDSITQGYGAVWAGASYINVFSRLYGCEVLNQAIGGYRFDEGGVQRIEGYDPDIIIVALGTNYYNDLSSYDYETETIKFFAKLNNVFPDKKIVVITPVWRNDSVDWDRFNWCIDVIRSCCKRYENVMTINGFDLIPNVNECYLEDKVHPNAYGMLLMGTNLYEQVKNLKF